MNVLQLALVILIPFTDDRITASGKYCVHGFYGNHGAVGTYYAGAPSAFHEVLTTLLEAKEGPFSGPNFSSKKIVLHSGRGVVPSYVVPDKTISTDWLVQTWPVLDSELKGPPAFHLQIDVWLGGNLELDKLKIPDGFTVESGGEIEAFVERYKTQSAPEALSVSNSIRTSFFNKNDASPNAIFAATLLGKQLAKDNMKAGRFRILEYGGVPGLVTIDPTTGYSVQSIAGCHFTASEKAMADSYNEVMRNTDVKDRGAQRKDEATHE
jgi:hypothetical protein